MIDKGQMLSRHDFSKVNWGILAAAALLFSVGAALLVLPLLSSIDESQVITLLQAGAGTILLGCTLLTLRHYLRPALTYRLYEHGVRVFDSHHHKERFIPFEKISDIYRFRGGQAFGGLFDVTAFRAGADQPWCTVFSNVAHSWRLADVIVDQQLQQRGPLALNALYQGDGVVSHHRGRRALAVAVAARQAARHAGRNAAAERHPADDGTGKRAYRTDPHVGKSSAARHPLIRWPGKCAVRD